MSDKVSGSELKKAIKSTGMDNEDVFPLLGISRATLYNYFKKKAIDQEFIKVVEEKLNVRFGHSPIDGKSTDRISDLAEQLNQVTEMLETIHTNLIETRHGVELTQALAKANLYQSAKLESLASKKSHQTIVEDLNKVTAKIFEETFLVSSPNSGV